MRRPARCIVALTLAALCLGSCTAWQSRPVGPPRAMTEQVRITRADGTTVMFRNPVVTPDSIVGTFAGVARSDIGQLEVRRFDGRRALRSLAVVGLGAAALTLAAFTMSVPD